VVTQPLERQFGQIPGVTQMTSSSALGNSAITVQFDLSRNIDGAGAGHPDGDQCGERTAAEEPSVAATYRKVNPADAPFLFSH